MGITASAGSSFDFGTLADPGLNTFLGNGVGGSALTLGTVPGVTVPAIGNTWAPNVQGANAQGKYTVDGAGQTLGVTGPVTLGGVANYALSSTTVLQLAQNP